MERKKTISASALLSKQLENITKTLAKASQRRDAELQRRRSKPTITSRDPSNCVLPTDVQARSSDKQSHYYQEQIERPKKDIPSVGVESLLASICATSPTEHTDQSNTSLLEAYKSSDHDEPWTLLKSIRQTLPSDTTAHPHSDRENTEPGRLSTQSCIAPVLKQTATDTDSEHLEDPSKLLAEFESLAVLSTQLSSKYRSQYDGDSEDSGVDLVKLRCGLDRLLVSPKQEDQTPPTIQQVADNQAKSVLGVEPSSLVPPLTDLDQVILPYMVAAKLEDQVSQWERVKGWTTYLFSNGPEGHEIQYRDEAAVLQATKILDDIIKKATDEELCRRRLIVCNIAAAAEEQDLQKAFSKLGVHDHDIHFTHERDPIRNTRTAYIDMVDRETAIEATHTRRHIFGLILDTKVAPEKTN